MGSRRLMLAHSPDRPELRRLLEQARTIELTDEVYQEQRASFAFGNAPAAADRITKESARAAALRNRLVGASPNLT